jgi:hypothetical protein
MMIQFEIHWHPAYLQQVMPNQFDPPPVEEVDLDKKYDIYVTEPFTGLIVYRSASLRETKSLARTARYDCAAEFIEILQSNGDSVFIRRNAIVKFCEPGAKLISEKISSQT